MNITELRTNLEEAQTYATQLEDLPARVALDKIELASQQFLQDLNPLREEANGTGSTSSTATLIPSMPNSVAVLDEVWLADEQAAKWLGLEGKYIVWLIARRHGFRYEHRDDQIVFPLSELERMQDNSVLWDDRRDGRELTAIGGDYMTQEEMDDLSAARPGRLPWKR
jgi:hypothetical protein